jgi:hypothetical protein
MLVLGCRAGVETQGNVDGGSSRLRLVRSLKIICKKRKLIFRDPSQKGGMERAGPNGKPRLEFCSEMRYMCLPSFKLRFEFCQVPELVVHRWCTAGEKSAVNSKS